MLKQTIGRQWQLVPHLNYAKCEIYEELPKTKGIGGPNLTWTTACMDLNIELRLLKDYERWVSAEHEQAQVNDQLLENGLSKEAMFYKNLAKDIEFDRERVRNEHNGMIYDLQGYVRGARC